MTGGARDALPAGGAGALPTRAAGALPTGAAGALPTRAAGTLPTGGAGALPTGAAGALLAPGAGADRTSSALVAIDQALSGLGVAVRRMDFPYRQAGRRSPDRPPVLLRTVLDQAADLAAELGVGPDRLVLGGRSMGGRICSLAVADGLACAGLILVSYPLHPPGRPDRLRTEHFPTLAVPCLFVSGTRDAFGRPDELTAATAAIAGPVTHRWIEGKDHGLRGCDRQVAALVAEWVRAD